MAKPKILMMILACTIVCGTAKAETSEHNLSPDNIEGTYVRYGKINLKKEQIEDSYLNDDILGSLRLLANNPHSKLNHLIAKERAMLKAHGFYVLDRVNERDMRYDGSGYFAGIGSGNGMCSSGLMKYFEIDIATGDDNERPVSEHVAAQIVIESPQIDGKCPTLDEELEGKMTITLNSASADL